MCDRTEARNKNIIVREALVYKKKAVHSIKNLLAFLNCWKIPISGGTSPRNAENNFQKHPCKILHSKDFLEDNKS